MLWKELFNKVLKSTRVVFSSRPVRSFSSSTGLVDFSTTLIGFQSKQLIVEAGLSLGDVDEHLTIDVTLDGADE